MSAKCKSVSAAAVILTAVLVIVLAACGNNNTGVQGSPMADPAENGEIKDPAAEGPVSHDDNEKETNTMDIAAELLKCEAVLRAEEAKTPTQFINRALFYTFRYKSDDYEVEGYLALPADFASLSQEDAKGALNALVYCRGGNRSFGMLTPEEVCNWAAKGYACFGSQYRGNAGGTGKEDFGGDDVHDITNLFDIALEMPFVKGEKVYLLGFSRGGMMAYRACQDAGEKIETCVIKSGLADARIMYSRDPGMAQVYIDLVGGGPDEYPEEFDRRSATTFADQISVPILICQGTGDVRVVPQQARNMVEALKAAGKTEGTDYKFIVYENANHILQNTSFDKDAKQWFDEHPIN